MGTLQVASRRAVLAATTSSGGAPTIPAPFTQVNGANDGQFGPWVGNSPYNGWTADNVGAISNDTAFTVSRQGFTGTASSSSDTSATATYLDTFYVTRKVRKPWPISYTTLPGSEVASDSTYALSDWIYSTDTPTGSPTNNSTKTSPKPIANWVTNFRAVVGNTISTDSDPIEIVAGHRNARSLSEVACVVFSFTDGTNTVSATVASMTKSVITTDLHPVLVYRCPQVDITSLSAGLITCRAKVYPWIGGAASVRDSNDGTAGSGRDFGPRYLLKNTTIAATPSFAYVASTGNDGTGVVSTTAATAAATPFLTIAGALTGLDTAIGGTTGVDGSFIRVQDGTFAVASPAGNIRQKVGRVTVERSPTSTNRASVVITCGVAVTQPKLGASGTSLTSPVTTGCLRFRDVTLQRSGANEFCQGSTSALLEMQWEGVTFDSNTQTNTVLGSGAKTFGYFSGVTCSTTGERCLAIAQSEYRLFRGVSIDCNNLGAGIDAWNVHGCDILRLPSGGMNGNTARSPSGAMITCNYIKSPQGTSTVTSLGGPSGTTLLDGLFVCQNVVEWTTVTTGHFLGISNDGATYSNKHVCIHHNTLTGYGNGGQGRWNMMYDENATATGYRTSDLHSHIGNVTPSKGSKSDIFQGINNANPEGYTAPSPSQRLGNYPYLYGVGCQYEFMFYQDGCTAFTIAYQQVYGGVGYSFGASPTSPTDFKWADYKGTTPSPTAGAGGGTYTYTAGSPCLGVIPVPILPYDFYGTARPTTLAAVGAGS